MTDTPHNWHRQQLEQVNREWAADRWTTLREIAHDLQDMDGPALVAAAKGYTHRTQADLARFSGLTANTISTIARGKRPTHAQRAAILWGIAKGLGI